MLWNMRSITRHKKVMVIHRTRIWLHTSWPVSCLWAQSAQEEREWGWISAPFPHYNQIFSAHVILLLNTQTLAYTTQSYHIHPHTTKVLWRWASGEAVGVGYTGSCSCRPAHRRLSSIWSLSVRRSSQRNSAVDWVTEQTFLGPHCSSP